MVVVPSLGQGVSSTTRTPRCIQVASPSATTAGTYSFVPRRPVARGVDDPLRGTPDGKARILVECRTTSKSFSEIEYDLM